MYRRTTSNHFVSPLDDEIKEAMSRAGVEYVNPALLRDLSALQQGETLLPLSEVEQSVRKSAAPKFWDKKWHAPYGGKWTNRETAISEMTKLRMQQEAKIQQMLSQVDPSTWIGDNPLERALSFVKYLQDMKMLDAEGDACPRGNTGKEANEHFKDERKRNGDDAGKELSDIVSQKLKRKFGELVPLDIWRISQKLNEHAKLKRGMYPFYEGDKMGRETRVRPIASLTELGQAVPQFWALPREVQLLNIAQRNVFISERVRRDSKKQLIGLIIDVSGSMGEEDVFNPRTKNVESGYKVIVALGIVLNRLKAVYNGQAEVWYSFFDTSLHFKDSYYAHDAETAKEAMRVISEHSFSGGGTNISGNLSKFRKKLEDKDGRLPEIVLVSDGQDHVEGEALAKELYPFTLHAFTVGYEKNASLSHAARLTNGLAVENFVG